MTLVIVLGSIFTYFWLATAVHRRLGWHMMQGKNNYGRTDAQAGSAILSYFLLPLAICVLVAHSYGQTRSFWLPPKSVRQEHRTTELEARNRELERQLKITERE